MSAQVKKEKIGKLICFKKEASKPEGTIICLHGYGANGKDLIGLSQTKPSYTWIFPEGPNDLSNLFGFQASSWFDVEVGRFQNALENPQKLEELSNWSPNWSSSLNALSEVIDTIEGPLILGGFSQGSMMAMQYALLFPEKIKALFLLSSTVVNQKDWVKKIPQTDFPIYQAHGTVDPVLPFVQAEKLFGILKARNTKNNLSFHSFPGDHTIDVGHFNQWLKKLTLKT